MSIQYIKGVGPKRAGKLKKLNIYTVKDLLYYIPREYDDRSEIKALNQVKEGEKESLYVEIYGYPSTLKPRNNLSILKIPIRDNTGQGYLVWYNQDYMANQLKIGDKILVNGKVNRFGNEIQILSPVFDKDKGKKVGNIIPIYSLTSGLSNNEMVNIMNNGLLAYILERI